MPPVTTRAAVVESLRYETRGPLMLRLYANDFTPHRGQTLAEFTEAAFPGYAPIPLGEFADAGDDAVTLRHPKCTFRLAEDLDIPANVWGWYLTRGDAVIRAARLADGHGKPTRLKIAGSRVEITPTVKE